MTPIASWLRTQTTTSISPDIMYALSFYIYIFWTFYTFSYFEPELSEINYVLVNLRPVLKSQHIKNKYRDLKKNVWKCVLILRFVHLEFPTLNFSHLLTGKHPWSTHGPFLRMVGLILQIYRGEREVARWCGVTYQQCGVSKLVEDSF